MTCAAAGLALAVAALAACTGSDPAPTDTSAVVPTTTTSATPTSTAPSTTGTSAGPAFPAGLPDAAKTKDKAGAEAFVRYFIAELNASWRNPDPTRLEPLCLPQSKSCASFVGTATELVDKGQRYASNAVRIDRLVVLAATYDPLRVQMFGGQTGARIVDKYGKKVDSDARSDTVNMFYLSWTRSGWAVQAIKDVE